MNNITFPYNGCFISLRKGYTWRFTVYENGRVDGMWRRENKRITGGWKEIEKRVHESKECLDAIEKQIGRRTDGWTWID